MTSHRQKQLVISLRVIRQSTRMCLTPGGRFVHGACKRPWRSHIHRFTTSLDKSLTAPKARIVATPPLPVRAALVATTTAIGTPAFPVVGFINFAFRYIVFDRQSRQVLLGATTIGGAMWLTVKIASCDLLPWVYSYSQLFLPFAMVNGVLAGAAYVSLDLAFGLSVVSSSAWSGAAMGAFVGAVGPLSGLYDVAFEWCWDTGPLNIWDKLLNNSIVLPIATTTGAAVGALIHPLLYYPITGIPGVSWFQFSAPILAVGTALIIHLYKQDSTSYTYALPEASYLTDTERQNMTLVPRYHVKSLESRDWSADTGYLRLLTGKECRDKVRKKLNHCSETPVFDSKRKACTFTIESLLLSLSK